MTLTKMTKKDLPRGDDKESVTHFFTWLALEWWIRNPHEIFEMFCYFIQLGSLTIPVIFNALMKNTLRKS